MVIVVVFVVSLLALGKTDVLVVELAAGLLSLEKLVSWLVFTTASKAEGEVFMAAVGVAVSRVDFAV